jgi:F-type H+-transporting ATPase subunit gamma
MASLQELRKRLRTIQSTGQLAGAMRTAATAKYARLTRVREDFTPYARACREMLSLLGGIGLSRDEDRDVEERDCLVILSGNRGLCGGFNAELLRFLDAQLPEMRDPLILVCGKKAAAHLRERGIPFEDYTVSDVPSFQEVKPLAERLRVAYTHGEADRVLMMYQHFQNTLVQIPTVAQLLPEKEGGSAAGEENPLLLLPDRETIIAQLVVNCLDTRVFELALESASGAQAATLMAMRSACDNAEEYAANLEITINRRRQADVTSSVIKTASGNVQQGD